MELGVDAFLVCRPRPGVLVDRDNRCCLFCYWAGTLCRALTFPGRVSRRESPLRCLGPRRQAAPVSKALRPGGRPPAKKKHSMTSGWTRLPAEFKHIIERRKRKQR